MQTFFFPTVCIDSATGRIVAGVSFGYIAFTSHCSNGTPSRHNALLIASASGRSGSLPCFFASADERTSERTRSPNSALISDGIAFVGDRVENNAITAIVIAPTPGFAAHGITTGRSESHTPFYK